MPSEREIEEAVEAYWDYYHNGAYNPVALIKVALQAAERVREDEKREINAPKPLNSPPPIKTVDDLKSVIRAWLDADDPTHWGAFERGLNGLINPTEEQDT